MLEARDSFKAQKELLNKNKKLSTELNKLRKKDFQSKMQIQRLKLGQEKHIEEVISQNKMITKKNSIVDKKVNHFKVEIDLKKNNIMKDLKIDHLKPVNNKEKKVSRLTGIDKKERM